MQVGILVPVGYRGEFAGLGPADAWSRTLSIARQAEELGFESIWAFDHFYPLPGSEAGPELESFTVLAGLATATSRVRLGHLVLCAAFRNPALTAKMAATLDVMSGGRFELGIGAGWKEDEWRAFGYGYPPLRERLAILADSLEVISRMLAPGRASFEGPHAHVHDVVNDPRGLQQPRIPLIVGGKGPNVTFRLAARFADEANLSQLDAEQVAALLPVIRQRCEEIGRDPATLRVSVYAADDAVRPVGQQRVDFLAGMAALGLARLMAFPARWGADPEVQARFAEDCRTAGLLP